MNRSEHLDKLVPALFAVKKELVGVKKSSNNPFFKSKYADLNAHLDLIEPLLEKHGCFLMQPPSAYGAGETISETVIFHGESGQWISGSMTLVVGKPDMQQLGAAATYARRFVLGGLLAVKTEDDDGNTATGKTFASPPVAKIENKPSSFATNKKSSGGGFAFKKKTIESESTKTEAKEGDMY